MGRIARTELDLRLTHRGGERRFEARHSFSVGVGQHGRDRRAKRLATRQDRRSN
jgi:hypothetical protein